MTELMFWNRVNTDGTGDFVHAFELFNAARKHEGLSKKYNFTLIIVIGVDGEKLNASWKKHYERFKQQIESLNLPADRCYFGTYEEVESQLRSPEFQARCLLARQHISISQPTNLLLKQPIAPEATVKYILEHESNGFEPLFYDKLLVRHMGLAPRKYGIKVPTIDILSPQDALSQLPQEDPNFWHVLSSHTKSDNPGVLLENNLLFTAYLSDARSLTRFLPLITSNPSLPKYKNIILYYSSAQDGVSLIEYFRKEVLPACSRMESIKEIELIEKNGDTIHTDIIKMHPEGKVLRIFCNFRVNNAAFNALFSAAMLVGVSGDTSFERAVAFQKLPFYFSNNYSFKRETLVGLQRIIMNADLGIPESIKQDFITYFKYEEKWSGPIETPCQRLTELKNLDLTGMCAEWPKIASYLREHFNLYTFLPQLIEEVLTAEQDLYNEARHPHIYGLTASHQTDSPLVQHSVFAKPTTAKATAADAPAPPKTWWDWLPKFG